MNEMNVYKTVKVVSLAFKMTKLEQELHYDYIKGMLHEIVNKEIIRNNDDLDNSSIRDQFEMEREKVGVLIDKIKTDFLFARM